MVCKTYGPAAELCDARYPKWHLLQRFTILAGRVFNLISNSIPLPLGDTTLTEICSQDACAAPS